MVAFRARVVVQINVNSRVISAFNGTVAGQVYIRANNRSMHGGFPSTQFIWCLYAAMPSTGVRHNHEHPPFPPSRPRLYFIRV